jgi:hypothetical protein
VGPLDGWKRSCQSQWTNTTNSEREGFFVSSQGFRSEVENLKVVVIQLNHFFLLLFSTFLKKMITENRENYMLKKLGILNGEHVILEQTCVLVSFAL